MTSSIEARSAEIANWMVWTRIEAKHDDVMLYSRIAASWEFLRALIAQGKARPDDAEAFVDLSERMRELIVDFGFEPGVKQWHLVPVVSDRGTDIAVAGITDSNGFVIGDPDRIVKGGWEWFS